MRMDRELLMLSIQSREPPEALRERLSSDGGLDRIREQMRRGRQEACFTRSWLRRA
jgi:hypothetical protein